MTDTGTALTRFTRCRWHPLPWLAGCALTVLLPSAGGAQRVSPDSALVLDSLEVTILRTRTSREGAPYSVSVLGEDALGLGKTGAFLEEALRGLPGVQLQNRFNFAVGERLAIRGFGARAQFGVRGVKILVDGIPATMPDGQSSLDHLDLSTLGRAEVLRGPGSALYGNAAGGVLTLETRPPYSGTVEQEARAVWGSHGLLDLDAVTSGTIGRTGFLAGVGRLAYDGFRNDPTREGAAYGAADREHFNGQLTHPVGDGLLRVTLNVMNLDSQNPGSISAADLEAGGGARAANVLQRTGKDVTQKQLGVSWEGPGPGGEAEVAAWGVGRSVLNPIPTDIIDLDRNAGGVRALLRGERDTGIGPVRWTSGVEAELQDDDRHEYRNDGGEAVALLLDQKEKVVATGVFTRLALGLGGGVEASASLRWDRVGFEADDRLVSEDDPDDSGERTLHGWSPSVGLSAEISPSATLWANVATSLETPTTTELVNRPDGGGGFNPDLDPQKATGLEVGARGRVTDRLSWEVSLFHTEISDELVPFEVEGQAGRTFYRNAGSSQHEGVEASVTADLGEGLSARAAWTRIDARYESFEVDGEDYSGNRIPGLAPYRVSSLLTQERTAWFWAVEAVAVGAVPTSDAGAEEADAYELVDLRAGLRSVRLAGLDVTPFVGLSNVFDKSYVAAVTVNAFGRRYYEPGPGRTVHIGANVSWRRR